MLNDAPRPAADDAAPRAAHPMIDAGVAPLSRRGRWTFIGLEAALIVVARLAGWLLNVSPLATLSWSATAAAWGLAAALPLVALVIAFCRWPWPAWRRLLHVVEQMLVPLFGNWSLAELALVSALAGIGEEMLFRGVLQAWLSGPLGAWGAVVVAGAAFGAVHWITPLYALAATLMGIYLGALWLATDNLLVPMLTHAWYDFLVLFYLVRIRGRKGCRGMVVRN